LGILKSGIYTISLRMQAPTDASGSAVYVDYGQGFSEETKVDLHLRDDGLLTAVLDFPVPPVGLRLDPCDVEGQILISDFCLAAETSHNKRRSFTFSDFKSLFMRIYGFELNAVLKPMNQLTYTGGSWFSSGDDPHFKLSFSRKISPGWYVVEVDYLCSQSTAPAKFYIDYGSGFNEKDTFSLNLVSGRINKRVIWFQSSPVSIRFDPCESETQILTCHVRLIRVTKGFAHSRILKKLVSAGLLKPEADVSDADLGTYSSLYVSRQQTDDVLAYQSYLASEDSLKMTSEEVDSLTERVGKSLLLSVIMPTYNTEPRLLFEAVESLLHQSYENWELCLTDDCSSDQSTRDALKEIESLDERIKVIYRTENGNISAASNTALEACTGDYVVLMDHDDVLASDAFIEVVKVIDKYPDTLFIYSDEDKLGPDGERYAPYFKPGWNPDLFYSQNYLNHLTVLQTARLKSVGGWRLGYEGAQDHDLYLRYLDGVDATQIHHIPRVLYHWRAVEGSTALVLSEKSYAVQRGLLAVEDFFRSRNPDIEVSMLNSAPHFYVKYPIPDPAPKVSLIIPTKDMAELVKGCVHSIIEHTKYPNYEIIIVNNNSEKEDTFILFDELTTRYDNIKVLDYNYPFNFSAINNYAAEHADGEILGLINNDIVIINDGWLTEMVSHAVRPDIGCVGAKLYYDDNTIQHAGVVLGIGGVAGHSHKYFRRDSPGYYNRLLIPHSVSAVTAACMVVRKSVYKEVGGLNEEELTVAFNDVDFCLKVGKAGYRNFWTPFAEAYHLESKSRGAEDTPEKRARFLKEVGYMKKTWGGLLENDPYYSPLLSREMEDYSIRRDLLKELL